MFRDYNLTAESVEKDAGAGYALHSISGPDVFGQPTEGTELVLGTTYGDVIVTAKATATGNVEAVVRHQDYLPGPGLDLVPGTRIILRSHPTADGPAVEVQSLGDVKLTPASGKAVLTPRLACDDYTNFRIATPIVATNAAGEGRYTFPTPFPVGCFGAVVGSAGTFGAGYIVTYLGADAAGVNVKLQAPNGALIANTSALISVFAVGR